MEAKLDKDSTGLARPNLPNDEALAALTESGYEYEIYTHISHGNPAVINEMRAMYRGDEGAAASALTNVILAALHAYGLAAWALGSYILEGQRLEELRTLLIQMYQAIGAASDFCGYLESRH